MRNLSNEQNYCDHREDKTELAVQRLAKKIISLRLQVPATFFLEMHVPITTIAHSATLVLEPLTTPLFGAERIEDLKIVLSERKNIERLIDLIQESKPNRQELHTTRQ